MNLFIADAGARSFWMPEVASEYAANVDGLFAFILYLSTFFFILLGFLAFYWAWKYRASVAGDRKSSPIAHNFKLEFLWSAVPAALLVVMFVWGFSDYATVTAAPADALDLRIIGRQWSWSVGYPSMGRECISEQNERGVEVVEFYAPVGRPLKLQMSSEDVIHSFWIPAFRMKRDALPNRYTGFVVTPTREGTFPVYCAEYCGEKHSQMEGRLHVLSQEAWEEKFVNSDLCKMGADDPDYGKNLFARNGCSACHATTEGQPATIGPNLFGTYGTEVDTDKGTVMVDEDYLRESIEEPQAKIVKGFERSGAMPSFKGKLNETEMGALIDYIKNLK